MSTPIQTYKPDDKVPSTMIPPCVNGETFAQCEDNLKRQVNIARLNAIMNSGVLSNTALHYAERDYSAFQRCVSNPNEKCIVDQTSIWDYVIPILIFLIVVVIITRGKDIVNFFKGKYSSAKSYASSKFSSSGFSSRKFF